MFYRFVRKLVQIVLFFIFPMKVENAQNMPEEGGLILCCNHISLMDPVYLSRACKRSICYMAKDELFRAPVFGRILHALGAFPIKRGARDAAGIHVAEDLVKQGKVMGIFAEGTRSKDLTPQRAKPGVALISYQTGADVLPVAIFAKKKVRPFRKVIVRFGTVLPNASFGFEKGAPSEYKNAANKIMAEVRKLWEESHWA